MTQTTALGPAIQIGWPYRNRIVLTAPGGGPGPALFPAGCALLAQVRSKRNATTVLVTLTTANGRITRVSDTEVDIYIPASETLDMPAGAVVELDFARTDLVEPEHLKIWMAIPVYMPVTRLV